MEATEAATSTTVAILAEDLIWASRLRAAVERAGGTPVVVRSAADAAAPFVVIDLTARGYDGVDAVRAASKSGATVLAVAQHEDTDLRKRALAAGARRVFSYNKIFSDGPGVIARMIGRTL